MLQSDILSYIKRRKYSDTYGFKFNLYYPCGAKNIVEVEPQTVVLHLDDSKASHKDTKGVDNFEQCIDFMYGDPNIVKVKSVRGKIHEYYSITLDYTTKGEVKIGTQNYVKKDLMNLQ